MLERDWVTVLGTVMRICRAVSEEELSRRRSGQYSARGRNKCHAFRSFGEGPGGRNAEGIVRGGGRKA